MIPLMTRGALWLLSGWGLASATTTVAPVAGALVGVPLQGPLPPAAPPPTPAAGLGVVAVGVLLVVLALASGGAAIAAVVVMGGRNVRR